MSMQSKQKYLSIIKRYQVQLTKYINLFKTEQQERRRLQAQLYSKNQSLLSFQYSISNTSDTPQQDSPKRLRLDNRSFCSQHQRTATRRKESENQCQQCPILQGQINELTQQLKQLQTFKSQNRQLMKVKQMLKEEVRELNIKLLQQEKIIFKMLDQNGVQALKDCSYNLLLQIADKKLGKNVQELSALMIRLLGLPEDKQLTLAAKQYHKRALSFFGR